MCVLLLVSLVQSSSQYNQLQQPAPAAKSPKMAQVKILSKRSALYLSVFRSGRLHAHSAGLSKYNIIYIYALAIYYTVEPPLKDPLTKWPALY